MSIQRSKQLAMMFLLGALLAGGAMGFSVSRYMLTNKSDKPHGPGREQLAEDLALTDVQRKSLDSILDARNCQFEALNSPERERWETVERPRWEALEAQKKTIADSTRRQITRMLTESQRQRFEARIKESDGRRDARRDSARARDAEERRLRNERSEKLQKECAK